MLGRARRFAARAIPEMGREVAIDASDMPAYANGQRYIYNGGPERQAYSDPDASWGHRSAVSTRKGGGFYGYRLHAAVCTRTGLPLAWEVKSARDHETLAVPGAVAIFPLRETPQVKAGAHLAPTCEHGTWTFAGADFKRKAAKWRCPTGECEPKSLWRRASRIHPLIPRGTKR